MQGREASKKGCLRPPRDWSELPEAIRRVVLALVGTAAPTPPALPLARLDAARPRECRFQGRQGAREAGTQMRHPKKG